MVWLGVARPLIWGFLVVLFFSGGPIKGGGEPDGFELRFQPCSIRKERLAVNQEVA